MHNVVIKCFFFSFRQSQSQRGGFICFLISLQCTRIIYIRVDVSHSFLSFSHSFLFCFKIYRTKHEINNAIIKFYYNSSKLFLRLSLLSLFPSNFFFLFSVCDLCILWRYDVSSFEMYHFCSACSCHARTHIHSHTHTHVPMWIHEHEYVGSVHIVWWIPIGSKSNDKESHRSEFDRWKFDCIVASATISIRYTTITKRWVWFDWFECGQLSRSAETISKTSIVQYKITGTMCPLYVHWRVWTLVGMWRWIHIR